MLSRMSACVIPTPCPEDRVPREGETIYSTRIHSRSRADYLIDHATGCWIWQKALTATGYPAGKGKPHRLYFQRANPTVEIAGLDIHHKCENTSCVNPAHLEPVSRRDHLTHHRRADSRFTEQDIADIRASTDSMATLAKRYGVPEGTIGNIWHQGAWWKGVGPDRPLTYCKVCGEQITTGKRHKQYCTDTCKLKARYQRLKARRTETDNGNG